MKHLEISQVPTALCGNSNGVILLMIFSTQLFYIHTYFMSVYHSGQLILVHQHTPHSYFSYIETLLT